MFDKNFTDGHYLLGANAFMTALAANDLIPVDTAFFDMMDYERIVFLVKVGTLTTETTFQLMQDTAATAAGDIKVVTGALLTVGATDDNDLFALEVTQDQLDMNNGFRYVTLKVGGATGSDDYAAVIAIGIKKGQIPVTQPALTLGNVVVLAPGS